MSSGKFEFPECYSFPPFFSIQPVEETREKQLSLWRDLILSYHTSLKIKTLVVHDCPLWTNVAIGRSLSPQDIQSVMRNFVDSGHGEWEDDDNNDSNNTAAAAPTRCRIFWRKPHQLASDIYDWAEANGFIGSICTLYELHSGEDVHGTSFQGADEDLVRRSLRILESQGKCTIFQGETSSEDGIKFF